AWRGYTWASGDIAGAMGNHQQANGLGGGIGLGSHGLDVGFGPGWDSWFGIAGLHTWAQLPKPEPPLDDLAIALQKVRDDGGHSNVVYDETAHEAYVYCQGKLVGMYPMCHDVAKTDASGNVAHNLILGDGAYDFLDKKQPHTHPGGQGDTENGSYGPYGIFRLDHDKYPMGREHAGIGVHSGRADTGSWTHVTAGCFRTTDAGMLAMISAAAYSPLSSFIVVHAGLTYVQ
ncbi:MAG: hypothetical protein AB1503_13125, partial [Bacillota bacterium]